MQWLSTVECAECINRALRDEHAIGPWYIRDAIRRGELVARVRHEAGTFRKRAKFKVAPEDFEAFIRKTNASLAPQVLAVMHTILSQRAA